MIKGNRASSYFTTFDSNGRKIEGEMRQCAHCQFSWIYQSGSGRKRGFCYHCQGLTCGRKVCQASCAPFWDIAQEMGKGYVFDPINGIFIKSN